MKRFYYIVPVLISAVTWSCTRIEKLPPEPRVEFRSMEVFDTTDILGNMGKAGRLTFYFEDGDGDLGITDTVQGSDENNLFLHLFRKVDGQFVKATADDPLFPSTYRIPYLETPGQIKILKGTIDVTIIYFLYNDTDTLYYDFSIVDRAGNYSNRDTTCVVVLGENGKCYSE